MMVGVREIDRSLEQWQMGVKDLQRRMILGPTPSERERWYAIMLLAQGLTAEIGDGRATVSPLYESSFEFRVRAVNKIGKSAWSEAATAED